MVVDLEDTIKVVRVIEIGALPPTKDNIWFGDIDSLIRQYPPSDIHGADPFGRSEIDGGWITTDYNFEQWIDGKWALIEDPRYCVDADMSSFEILVDAENRRDFPGDYIVDDDDRCPGCDKYESDCICDRNC